MATAAFDLLLQEYREVNAHLRANITQFVNWFSFSLIFSFGAAAIFVAAAMSRPQMQGSALAYGAKTIALLLNVLALAGILTFRRYIAASHCKVEEIAKQIGGTGGSPIPVRFCQWMTDLMAAGFVLSYFTWFSLFFLH